MKHRLLDLMNTNFYRVSNLMTKQLVH